MMTGMKKKFLWRGWLKSCRMEFGKMRRRRKSKEMVRRRMMMAIEKVR